MKRSDWNFVMTGERTVHEYCLTCQTCAVMGRTRSSESNACVRVLWYFQTFFL
jgi:hypothetical protein